MKEGFWTNYATGQTFEIDEHELWLRRSGNAQRLGVPDEVVSGFAQFLPIVDRDHFIKFVTSQAPIMRVRGHGEYISFEFSVPDDPTPALNSILRFCNQNAGPRTWLRIGNLAKNRTTYLPREDFVEKHRRGEISNMALILCTKRRRHTKWSYDSESC